MFQHQTILIIGKKPALHQVTLEMRFIGNISHKWWLKMGRPSVQCRFIQTDSYTRLGLTPRCWGYAKWITRLWTTGKSCKFGALQIIFLDLILKWHLYETANVVKLHNCSHPLYVAAMSKGRLNLQNGVQFESIATPINHQASFKYTIKNVWHLFDRNHIRIAVKTNQRTPYNFLV